MNNASYISTSARKRLYQARDKVVRSNVFFARTAYVCKLIEDNKFPTAYTDGIDIYYNSDFINKLENIYEVSGVFLHELLHVQLCHVSRMEDRNPEIYNVAADIRVNYIINHDTNFSLPNIAIDPDDFKTIYQNMSVEAIYADLYRMAEAMPQFKPQGHDQLQKPSPEKLKEIEEAQRNMARAVQRGLAEAKKAGQKVPGIYKAFGFNEVGIPLVDWRDIVREMILNERRDISGDWMRPNRRFISSGLYLPGPMETSISKLVICWDTSGSMWNKKILDEMKNEACSLLEEEITTNVHIICTDTKIQSSVDATCPQDVEELEMKGGGGTDFKECMDYVKTLQDVCGCVFFTDMESYNFGEDPGFPVIWVDWRTNQTPWSFTPTYGTIYHIGAKTSRA